MIKQVRKKVLTGNSFPMNLIRRTLQIRIISLDEYRDVLATTEWKSYWGHTNTLQVVKSVCGYDLTPFSERPALTLDSEGYPALDGESYRECYVLSPEYEDGYRPALNAEVPLEKIRNWHVLHMIWS